MAFDTLLQATWSEWDLDINEKIRPDRELFMATLVDQEKMDAAWETISAPGELPCVFRRRFADADAANSWADNITAICLKHNVVPPVFEII